MRRKLMIRLKNLFKPIQKAAYFQHNFNKIEWVLPFLAFIIGYFFLQFFIADHAVQMPNLLGQNLLQATQVCSKLKLNVRIITEKEVADLQPGTIITQKPLPGKAIKPHQSIFIVITKLPDPIFAPDFIKKNSTQIEIVCREKGIKNNIYIVESSYPKDECFGQIPLQGQPLELKKISCYISAGNVQQYLFPNFINIPVYEVIEFLNKYNISCDVYNKDQKIMPPYQQNIMVLNQKPLAGTFVQLNNKLYVQLQVA